MAFRRKFRRFRRARRGPETYTIVQCREFFNILTNSTCSNPGIVNAFQVLGPLQATGVADPTEALGMVDVKSHLFKGMKFQAEWLLNPADVTEVTDPPDDPLPSQVTFLATIWEAIVLLPLARGSKTLPAYLPQFTTASDSFDLADRVLWKRLSIIPFWGLGTTGGVPQLEATMRDTAAGPQFVKARCTVDDKHALFYVTNIIHNLFVTSVSPFSTIPLQLDFWAKVYYGTRLGK